MDKVEYLERYLDINERFMCRRITPIEALFQLDELNTQFNDRSSSVYKNELMPIQSGQKSITEEDIIELIPSKVKERWGLSDKKIRQIMVEYWNSGDKDPQYFDIYRYVDVAQMWLPSSICW